MKKPNPLIIAVSPILLGAILGGGQAALAQTPAQTSVQAAVPAAPQPAAQVTTQAVPAAPVTAPVAPRAPVAPVAGTAAPAAPTTPAASTPAVPAATAPAAPVTQITGGIGKPPAPKQQGAPEDLRQAVGSGDFLKKLSWPLTEQQMIEFARASVKVGKINSKWDVQIASTETDQMAIEYNNMAVEEIEHSLKSIPGLTLDQYNELTHLTATDKEFNSIYMAYKQLVNEGAFGEIPKAGKVPVKEDPNKMPATSNMQRYGTALSPVIPNAPQEKNNTGLRALPPAAQPGAGVTPPSTEAGSGTAPAPQGSPTPPYSQPAAR